MPVERKRRPDGWLTDQLLELLRDTTRPLGVYVLAEHLQHKHSGIYASAVFRAINRLVADGQVGKIESVSGYVLRSKSRVVDMVCSECRQHEVVDSEGTFERLAEQANSLGFVPSRYVLEVNGKCDSCIRATPKSEKIK